MKQIMCGMSIMACIMSVVMFLAVQDYTFLFLGLLNGASAIINAPSKPDADTK